MLHYMHCCSKCTCCLGPSDLALLLAGAACCSRQGLGPTIDCQHSQRRDLLLVHEDGNGDRHIIDLHLLELHDKIRALCLLLDHPEGRDPSQLLLLDLHRVFWVSRL